MDARILTLRALFQKDVRYQIPMFQRPYVWNQEDQWEPLWDDLRNTAEQYLEELDVVGHDNAALAEERTPSHFLGAVVVKQRQTSTAEIETRDVIDGQQRLTTLQLVLDAVQQVLEERGVKAPARRLSKLVLNDEYLIGDEPDHIFKIWPTSGDQSAFRNAMRNDAETTQYSESRIVLAHEFFQLQTEQWLGEAESKIYLRAQALETALVTLFDMVVIDLTQNDDEHIIFETLNARGTPLLASDLIKNFILYKTKTNGTDAEDLHRENLAQFETEWWRKEISQGRIRRPRVDAFLNYWLTMETKSEVQSSDVFPSFRNYAEAGGYSMQELAQRMSEFGDTYERISSSNPPPDIEDFIYRCSVMNVGVITPLLLWLFSRAESVPGSIDLPRALNTLESFLVRRMAGRLTTKGYNILFLDALEYVSAPSSLSPDQRLIEFLIKQDADSRYWPNDADLVRYFAELPLYRLLTRGRLRLLLEGIEVNLRSRYSESVDVPRGLTIEHVMPQKWRAYWPLDADVNDDKNELAERRDHIIHTVGNLTLVNSYLNPALSNAAWESKRVTLGEHSVLHLNKNVLEHGKSAWDEHVIRERGKKMAGIAMTIWPHGDAKN
ncbi:MAG: DUF262 domain-containing protein [Chloroflexi bacterium]|nr:DUF262 domain-containing protein [Chloroflexota bacterium]